MDNLLLEICGKELYFDIDKLSELVKIEEVEKECIDKDVDNDEDQILHDESNGTQIDVTKYEMYRELMGTLLMYNEQVDNKMGMIGLNNSTTVPFKLAYNTLLIKGVLKEL
jgi:hypothetical protein|tara:strand:+ start:681 stop:1013 length:333 start_codon:yes stop_codon:yes gene_type:complete